MIHVLRFVTSRLAPFRRGRLLHTSARGNLGLRAAACAMLVAGASACTGQIYPELSAADANAQVGATSRLGAGDKLRVTVYEEPTLTGEYEVSASGAITLPLVADVAVANATPDLAAKAVSAKLTEGGYVLNPRVSVEVVSHRPFYILGEVSKPGEYTYAGQLSLLQAIAKAGGFTNRANKASVIVRRTGWSTGHKVLITDPALMIAPGDTITITESLL